MSKLGMMIVLLVLGACTYASEFRTAAEDKGAEFYDAVLEDAEFKMCYAASIGSVRRRYGVSVKRAKLYNELCNTIGTSELVIGPLEDN